MRRKRAQLVCQHLENISRRLLDTYRDVFRALVRGRHGIYALYRKDRLYYVGLATNLRGRLAQHLRDRHAQTWDRFSLYLTVGDKHLHEIESLLIHISNPRGNKVRPGFSRSENLLRSLRRRIKEHQTVELDKIAPVRRRKKKAKPRKAKPRKVEGRTPTLAPYVTRRFLIRLRYKGKTYQASVRKDGSIYRKGQVFTSPSSAARAVIPRHADGWHAWRYERAPGDWVTLDNLRK